MRTIKVTIYPFKSAFAPTARYCVKKIVGALDVPSTVVNEGLKACPGGLLTQTDAESLVRNKTRYEVTVVEAPAE